MKLDKLALEVSLVVAIVCIISMFFLGCTVQKPPPPVAAVQAPMPPPPPPMPELWASVSPPPPAPQPPQRVIKEQPHHEVLAAGGRTIYYEPGVKYTLPCAEFGAFTIKFPAGETIKKLNSGNNSEWMVDQAEMGIELPIAVVGIRRAPYASPTELHVITDAAVYQFLLIPTGGRVSKEQSSLITVLNPETEARQARQRELHMAVMEQERRERVIQAPQLDASHIRTYAVGGDHVAWMPISVVGDQQHTVIQLPAATGAEQPVVTVIEGGKEQRVNVRTLPEGNGIGPQLVLDQPVSEAKLVGAGGTVRITGGGH